MVKRNKKNIKDIQEALLSNTDFMNKGDSLNQTEVKESVIDNGLLDKFEALAEFEKTTTKELVSKALNHFLKLKGLQLEQALKARK